MMKKLFILLLALMLLSGCSSKTKTPEEVRRILKKYGYEEKIDYTRGAIDVGLYGEDGRSFDQWFYACFNNEGNPFSTFIIGSTMDVWIDFSESDVILIYSYTCSYDFKSNTADGCVQEEIDAAKKLRSDFVSQLKEMGLTVSDVYHYLYGTLDENGIHPNK